MEEHDEKDKSIDSVLLSVKRMLGLEPDNTPFDEEIIMHINSAFTIIYQLGYGDKPVMIRDASSTWSELFADDMVELLKSYTFLKVKLLFDPPQSGVLHEAMERQTSEFEWRLNVQVETPSLNEKYEPATESVMTEDTFYDYYW